MPRIMPRRMDAEQPSAGTQRARERREHTFGLELDRRAQPEWLAGEHQIIIRAWFVTPRDHPIGSKRLCLDTGYYETYNRDNVTLVDVRSAPIEEITAKGVRTTAAEYEVDAIVFATGFDAMTGALLRVDIRGKGGVTLQEAWSAGPRTYLGLGVHGFPNLFTITGPGSPSVLTNMLTSIQQHVEWIADCIAELRERHLHTIEAELESQDAWVDYVNAVAGFTLFPTCNSWYLGANVPGKTRVFMPLLGYPPYEEMCTNVANNNYEGFKLSAS